MFDETAAKLTLEGLAQQGFEIGPRLTAGQLEAIEQTLGAKLPPELRLLLQSGVPGSKENPAIFPDWGGNPQALIQEFRQGVELAFTTAIENNDYWLNAFGEKPSSIEEAKQQALQIIHKWPPLVRIHGHRYMPTQPAAAGNPIFSVWEAGDTIYYGYDFVDYLQKEFSISLPLPHANTPVEVPFWDEAFGLR